jgi:hypothetical protein
LGSIHRYDTPFDKDDALVGTFTVSLDNAFLENKFGWQRGISDMNDVKQSNKELKASTGGCPMLHMGHVRTQDFEHPELVENIVERQNWFKRYVHETQGGVVRGSLDFADKSRE